MLSDQEELEMLELEKEKAMAGGGAAMPIDRTQRRQLRPAPPVGDRGEYYLNQVAKWPGQIASMPGLAVDAANSALGIGEHILRSPERDLQGIEPSVMDEPYKPIFPVDRPFGGSESIRSGVDRFLGVQKIKPPSLADEYGGLATELIGPSLPFSVRNIATAAHKIPAIAAEAGSIVGGTAGGVTGEYLGGDVGKAVGVAAGSTVPTIGPTATSKIGSMIGGRLSKAGQKAFAEREAGRVLKPAMESELATPQNMAQADEITTAINAATGRGGKIDPLQGTPFEPTIGARTNAGVVRELEAGVAGQNPQNLSRYAGRADQNQRALNEATTNLLGENTADTLPRQASSRLINSTQQIDSRLSQLERQQKAIAASTEGGPMQGKGEALREQYWKNRQGVKSDFNKAYEDLYSKTDKAGASIDMTDVRNAAAKIAGSDENVYQDMPRTFGKIKRQMGGEPDLPYQKPANILQESANARALSEAQSAGGKTTFREFHSLWKEVNTELGMAVRSGDTRRYEYLKQLKGALDDKLGQMESGGLGSVSGEFKTVNEGYKSRYAKVFKEGLGGKIADVGKYGATMDDAKVVERFFTPDGLDDFSSIYGADANAQKLLKDGVLGMFAKRAVDEATGKIKPAAAEAFMRQNAESLAKVPEVDKLLRNANATNEALIDRSIRLEQGKRALDRSALAKAAGSEDVGSLLTSASNSPKEMKRLFALSKGKEQRTALARSIADELPNIAQKTGQEPYAYLMSQEGTLRPIMDQIGPGHWDNLKTIAGGQTLQGRMEVPGRVNVPKPKDALFELTGSNARSIIQTYLSVARGRTGIHGESAQLFGRFAVKKREQMIDQVMSDAIYDPELAKSLASIVKGRPTNGASNKLGNWLQTNAFRTAVVAGDQQDNP